MTQRAKSRRGFTLLELMAVLSIITVLMALLSLLVSAMLQTQRQAMLRERQRLEYFRLDTILRADAHAATEVALKSPTDCELKNAQGERWTYRVEEGDLVRERIQAEKRVQREVFYVRPGTEIEFRIVREQDRSLLQLDLNPPTLSEKSAAHQAPYRGQILVGGALPPERRTAAKEQP